MSVDQDKIIDAIGIRREGGEVALTISDHLDWKDPQRHLELLQAKLGTYTHFVESGQLLEKYPDARGRPVLVDIVFKYEPVVEAKEFLGRAFTMLESFGMTLQMRRLVPGGR